MVYQVANAVKLPIIGMGGIATAEDALEFITGRCNGGFHRHRQFPSTHTRPWRSRRVFESVS
ncbi:MAG: hypothetical protein ACLUD2_14140 [Clostridium sp.]